MSVIIGSARIDEYGNISGGQAGDQKGGQEVSTQDWYLHSKGWYVLRPKNENVAAMIAWCMQAACDNDNIGYNQNRRDTLRSYCKQYNYDVSRVDKPCDTDCSALVSVCVCYAGIQVPSFNTESLKSSLESTGEFESLTDSIYCDTSDNLRRGDVLVTRRKGHTVVVLSNGSNVPQNYAMDGSTSLSMMVGALGSLYEEEVTREDAILREVGYLNNAYEPSIQMSSMKLSVINYTNLLGDLFSMYVPENILNMFSTLNVNVDGVTNTTAKAILQFILNKGLNAAAACGITANIQHESSYNPGAIGDGGTSFGLCQWHNTRGTSMKAYVGSNWATNVTGQLNFLWTELEGGYKNSTYLPIQAVPNTLAGAKQAADIFVRKFEMPSNVEQRTLERQATAEVIWNKLVIQQAPNNASNNSSGTTVNPNLVGQCLGNFKLTAYCNCSKCCGKWAGGPTASGTMPVEGRTVAVGDIAFGTKLLINGHVYTVEDRGTPYGHIDIYHNSHSAALKFGVQYADIYVVN